MDVLVHDERIVALDLDGDWAVEQVIDATGCDVLPGGVDAHTHFESPSMGFTTRTADDFHVGTVAAAVGGTTTVLDFVKKEPDSSLYDSFQRRRRAAERKACVDFGLHPVVPPNVLETGGLEDLRRLAAEGATSWKFFMAYPGTLMAEDPVLLAGMRLARQLDVLPMVHAENGHLISDATDRLVTEGRTAEANHHEAHTHIAETEAVNRAIALAESVGSPLFVVHVSSRFAAERLAQARADGLPVWGETCPHYLLLAYEDYADLGHEAAKYLCSPPIRERSNQEHLWHALARGVLSTVGTDHAAYTMSQPADLPPQKGHAEGYFPDVPNGVPGVEERLVLLYHAGVRAGRFDVCRFVDIVSTSPAKLFGLFPRKGIVAPGADADIVVLDPTATRVMSAAEHHSRADYNLYEGLRVTGCPRIVLSRGHAIFTDGEIQAEPGHGRYLKRSKPLLV